ncbi:MAG: ABC transporter ATP-binding protein [Nitrospirae bacterium]|nr:ABC transporter ATP-binding protein [Nitrospirota bacterium]
MSHHIIEFKDVSFVYPDGTEALKDVSFRVVHGEAVAIVGPNGAGKTTLLMLMNGLILPTSGEVLVGEVPVTKKTLPEIRRKVGVVMQNPDDQLFMPTVGEDVAFGPINMGLPEEMVIERVDEALKKVGCLHLKDRPPHRLSGGQKKAVAIAGVLAMKPDILVMDEPSAGLDPRARKALINLLKTFHHSKIIASHDLDLVLELCPRCIVLNSGQVLADGKARDLLLDEKLIDRAGLELPLCVQNSGTQT